MGGFGVTFRNFSVLFLHCVFGAALERGLERLWLHFGSLFGPILVPFGGPAEKVRMRLSLKRAPHSEGPKGVRLGTFCGAFSDAVSDPPFVPVLSDFGCLRRSTLGALGALWRS